MASELPYGRKRALEIATTLALDPMLLLLDEPMSGLGHEDIGRISALIQNIAKTRTVLMVEHNLSVVADLSDRSEEHTSELQSLMRSSYAVFCFKKKSYSLHE